MSVEKCTIEELKKILFYIMRGYKVPKIVYDVIYQVAKREVEDKKRVVLMKRDPNIHRDRIQAFYVKIIEGETVELHPGSVGGFGADFDGDSVFCDVIVCYKDLNGQLVNMKINISEFPDIFRCRLVEQKVREDGTEVSVYELLEDVYIDSINIETGESSLKKIKTWSVHKNLTMFEIEGKDVDKLVVSSDHSLVVYDEKEDKIIRTSILEVQKDPGRYYLIKKKEKKQ